MSGRTGQSAVKSRSILDYFKPKSAVTPQAKTAKSIGTLFTADAVVDVSSGEDDDLVQVLTEIKCNSSGDQSKEKTTRKSAVSRHSFSSIPRPDDESIFSPISHCSSIRQGRDSGSLTTDDENSNAVPEEEMELDMSEFLDVLVDETGGEREDELRHAIAVSSTGASDEAVNSSENDYKLTNFRSMIDFVLNDTSHSHLLNAQDWEIIENITSLSVSAQRLFIRLYLRKHNWIRSSHINYPEVADPDRLKQLLRDLVQNKILVHCESL